MSCLPEKWLRSLPQTWNSLQSAGSGKKPGCRQRKVPALSDPSQAWVPAACVVHEALLQVMSGSISEQLMFASVVKTCSPMLAQITNLSQSSQYGPDALQAPAATARVPLLFVGGDTGRHCAHTHIGHGSHGCPIYLSGEPTYMPVLKIRHPLDIFIQNVMGEGGLT